MNPGVHTAPTAKKLEWFGLVIVKRYLQRTMNVKDVHADSDYFSKGIDLIVDHPRSFTIDLKVDSYIGSDSTRKIRGLCNPDSKMILIETLSQLQYDRNKGDVAGWFYTSEADQIFYYFLALLNNPEELAPIHSKYKAAVRAGENTSSIEDQLITSLKVDNDLLVVYDLKQARKWLKEQSSNLPVSWSAAPNPTYVTVSRRIPRQLFMEPQGPGRNLGRIYPSVVKLR
jgi:hypothetical protein